MGEAETKSEESVRDPIYRVVYRIEPKPEGITREQIDEEYGKDPVGAADGVIIHSILGTPGGPGPLSLLTYSYDGAKNDALTMEQQFTVWALWAFALSEKLPEGGRKALCSFVHEAIREAVTKDTKEEGGDGPG